MYLNTSYVIGLRAIVLFHKYASESKHCTDTSSFKKVQEKLHKP